MQPDAITFRFKQFALTDCRSGMKIGTDGVIVGALAGLYSFAGSSPASIADLGAGCGIISLMLAQRYPDAHIAAVEIDPLACCDFRDNVGASPWSSRISLTEGDYLALSSGSFDLIVSNPPFYLNGEQAPSVARAKARHAGSLSPLSVVDFAARSLTPGGVLSLIVPSESAADVIERAAFSHLGLNVRLDVITSARRGVTRTFLEFSNIANQRPVCTLLEINGADFKQLTKDFYLDSPSQ